jgi:hypothetical protein
MRSARPTTFGIAMPQTATFRTSCGTRHRRASSSRTPRAITSTVRSQPWQFRQRCMTLLWPGSTASPQLRRTLKWGPLLAVNSRMPCFVLWFTEPAARLFVGGGHREFAVPVRAECQRAFADNEGDQNRVRRHSRRDRLDRLCNNFSNPREPTR